MEVPDPGLALLWEEPNDKTFAMASASVSREGQCIWPIRRQAQQDIKPWNSFAS